MFTNNQITSLDDNRSGRYFNATYRAGPKNYRAGPDWVFSAHAEL